MMVTIVVATTLYLTTNDGGCSTSWLESGPRFHLTYRNIYLVNFTDKTINNKSNETTKDFFSFYKINQKTPQLCNVTQTMNINKPLIIIS